MGWGGGERERAPAYLITLTNSPHPSPMAARHHLIRLISFLVPPESEEEEQSEEEKFPDYDDWKVICPNLPLCRGLLPSICSNFHSDGVQNVKFQ